MIKNFLALEKSPYLKQHEDNPVRWYPWGHDAFTKAHKENKPIFLSIGYSTCHWCHVMAHESFEDEETAQILNQYFVAIKVDREERPDIDHIYMNAVMAINGSGGWPLSAFLMPDGKPFYGGTYFPPTAKWGTPGFKDILLSIKDAWDNNQVGIAMSSKELVMILKQSTLTSNTQSTLDKEILEQAYVNLVGMYDSNHGGFATAPKFPMGHTLSFLLTLQTAYPKALDMVTHTLSTMANRGIHDQLGSGFHRYATDAQWQIPHFEKMLYDQSLLVMAYAQAYQVTKDALYADITRSTLDYVLRDMTDEGGGFYCAYDADSHGVEGAYYVFTYDEIQKLLSEEEFQVFKEYFDVKPDGNVAQDPHGEFIKKNILWQTKEISENHRIIIAEAKTKLLQYRQARMQLHLDDKVLTDWNGLMIAAMSFAGAVLGETKFIDKAKRAADFILSQLKSNDQILHRWHSGSASINGMLDDYAYLSLGLVQLYEVTLEQKYLEAAEMIVKQMKEKLEDQVQGGFFMAEESEDLIVRPIDIYDGAMPSGNSVAAFVFMKLFFITSNFVYQDTAKKVILRFLPVVDKAPQGYTFFLQALNLLLQGPKLVFLEGRFTDAQLVDIQKIVYKCYMPNLSVHAKRSDKALSLSVCQQSGCGLAFSDINALEVNLQ